jgi:hypothetical protein
MVGKTPDSNAVRNFRRGAEMGCFERMIHPWQSALFVALNIPNGG